MNKERWGVTLDKVLSQFDVENHTKNPDEDGLGEIETVIFDSPLGKVKLVYTTRPVVLDKKVIGAHRRGKSAAQYEYVYSDTETSGRLEALKEEDGDWVRIDSQAFE
ncbi:MAG: hypothetical protein U9M89_00670 [Patescibacteria group bacterium]|nr:hypothetical protein [Patescibacteria group bacterium]